MTRVIAVGPGGKAQAPVRDDRARGVIETVIGMGALDKLLLSPRCRDRKDATELKQALYRSAWYFCSCGQPYCTRRHNNVPGCTEGCKREHPAGCPDGGQRVSCQADVVTVTGDDGSRNYHVQFRLFDKAEAMREVIAKYGPNPNQWPYYGRRKKASA